MKKLALAALGLSGVLAACDSAGTAPDGSASGRIVDLKTEYATTLTPVPQYIGCDNVTNPSTPSRAGATQVKVEFSAAGSIQSVDISLVSNTTAQADPNFVTTVQGKDLQKNSDGNYVVYFNANSDPVAKKLLPTSIVVSPADQKVKVVTPSNKVGQGFYTNLRINTGTSSFVLTSKNLRVVPVYSSCTIQNEAQPLSM